MEIKPHLSEAELAEFISDPTRGLGTHLELCSSCLDEVARLRERTADMKSLADRPQEFWDRQRTAIRTQIAALPTHPRSFSPRLVWAPAFVLLILAGLLVTGGTPAPPPIQSHAAVDPDHDLLIAVEQVMQSSGPNALEPATYFIQQISQPVRTKTRSTVRSQERHNAN
jgi:hypothetical protein